MKIGITERGDASLDYSWVAPVENNEVDGVVLITKNLTPKFIDEVYRLHNMGKKIIVHATCTGWGGTMVEPNVPIYTEQLMAMKDLLDMGFPYNRLVLRIDPIIPTPNGVARVCEVLNDALALDILPGVRVRISVLDEYKHVKERIKAAGKKPFYPEGQWQASDAQMKYLSDNLNKYNLTFYTCAESKLKGDEGRFAIAGCISKMDLEILDLPAEDMDINPQNRKGCTCLSCKTELLKCSRQCAHKCIYCYWRN